MPKQFNSPAKRKMTWMRSTMARPKSGPAKSIATLTTTATSELCEKVGLGADNLNFGRGRGRQEITHRNQIGWRILACKEI